MLIATWNVNSIRTRLSQIIDWINKANPDILCLQETKVMDHSFPIEPFKKLLKIQILHKLFFLIYLLSGHLK